MQGCEVKRPGRDEWEVLKAVPLADLIGTLVRYPSGIVLRVTGLTEPDAKGVRHLLMEVNTGE